MVERSKVNHDIWWLPIVIVSLGKYYDFEKSYFQVFFSYKFIQNMFDLVVKSTITKDLKSNIHEPRHVVSNIVAFSQV